MIAKSANLIEFKMSCEKSSDVTSTGNFHSSIPGNGISTSLVLSQDIYSIILDQFTKGSDRKETLESFGQIVKALLPESLFSSYPSTMLTTVSQGN
jgi:hypothetical protein